MKNSAPWRDKRRLPGIPQHPAHRHGVQTVSEWNRGLAVIHHRTARESLAQRPFQLAKTPKIARPHRSRRLDLDPRDRTGVPLDDKIDLDAVLVAEVVEGEPRIAPACLSAQLLKDEGLEELTEKCAIVLQRRTVHPQ